jgi:hypothetical protein
MTPEHKLYQLAAADSTLQTDLGGVGNAFQWWDKQVTQGTKYTAGGPASVSFLRVSTLIMYEQRGRNPMDAVRMQLDIRHLIAERARSVANDVVQFLESISLAQPNQFNSPATTPPQFPNFLLNRREGMDFQLQPPVHVVSLDVRLWNLEDY